MNQLQNQSFEEALVRYREKWDKIKDPCVVYDFPIPDVSCKELFLKRVSEHPDKTYVISRGAKISYVECNKHLCPRIYLLGFRYLLERCLPEPRIRRPYQDVRSVPRLCNRIQGLLCILHHQPHCNDLQCASLDGTGPSVIEHVRLRVHSR